MPERSMNFLEELESLTRTHWLDREDFDQIMIDFSRRIAACLKIERVGIWLFNGEHTAIILMAEYDTRTKAFRKDSVLLKKNYPRYFKALEQNKIILVEDIHTHEYTRELDADYSRPLGIESLMDIPIRISGELVGVMCFEKTGFQKVFTADEQNFAFSLSLVVSSNLEAKHRRSAQAKLEEALAEKDLLIKEINHRVKNNFAILISLLRISKGKGKEADATQCFEEFEQRIQSMLKIHDLLCETENYTSIRLTDYVAELIKELKLTHPFLNYSVHASIDNIDAQLPTKKAIHLGLMISEIFVNSIKYSYPASSNYQLYVEISQNRDKSILLKIGDNGPGFNFHELLRNNTMGLSIIKDLAEGMDLIAKYPVKKGDLYEFLIMPEME